MSQQFQPTQEDVKQVVSHYVLTLAVKQACTNLGNYGEIDKVQLNNVISKHISETCLQSVAK